MEGISFLPCYNPQNIDKLINEDKSFDSVLPVKIHHPLYWDLTTTQKNVKRVAKENVWTGKKFSEACNFSKVRPRCQSLASS